jgi:hypothetical protein
MSGNSGSDTMDESKREIPVSRRISFLICGAQKSGTSALHQYLRRHPQIDLPLCKELHLFDNESLDWSEQGINSIDQRIAHHFEIDRQYKHCGEATPNSLWWNPAMKRIWRYNPKIRLIAILRNPITRAFANWRMEQLRGRDDQNMILSLEEEEKRCRKSLPLQDRTLSYLSRGFYTEQIKRIWRFFPRDQLLVLKQENLLTRPEETLREIYRYLEIDQMQFKGTMTIDSWQSLPGDSKERLLSKPSGISTKIPDEIYNQLIHIYKNEIKNLEDILEWDCRDWIKQRSIK